MPDNLPTTFGKVLRKHRLDAGYTQIDLAGEAGLHHNAVGLLERGKRTANLETVFMLARTLDVKPSQLVAAVEKLTPRISKS